MISCNNPSRHQQPRPARPRPLQRIDNQKHLAVNIQRWAQAAARRRQQRHRLEPRRAPTRIVRTHVHLTIVANRLSTNTTSKNTNVCIRARSRFNATVASKDLVTRVNLNQIKQQLPLG
jgi:hypothetical protein